MRPIKLEFEGINSYTAKASVDFDKLLQYGLFGIFGNTGSGKSTILDAMLLALYSKTSKTNSPYEYINRKCLSAFVDFTFSIKEEGEVVVYKVKREFKFSAKKDNISRKSFLIKIQNNDENIIEQGNEKVDESVVDILGLNFDEFQKCIILPQGQFSAFVLMGNAERKRMMGSLFNLDKYGRSLVIRIKQSIRQFENEINSLTGNLKAYENATQEELDRLHQEIKERENEKIASDIIISKNQDIFNENKDNYERHKKLIEYKTKLELLLKEQGKINEIKQNYELYNEAKNLLLINNEIIDLEDTARVDKKKLANSQVLFDECKKRIDAHMLKALKISEQSLTIEQLKIKLARLEDLQEEEKNLEGFKEQIEKQRLEYKKQNDLILTSSAKLSKAKDELAKFESENNISLVKQQIDSILKGLDGSSNKSFIMDETDFLKNVCLNANTTTVEVLNGRIEYLLSLVGDDEIDLRESLFKLQNLYKKLDELHNAKLSLDRAISDANSNVETLKAKLIVLKEQGEKTKENISLITQKVNNVTGGVSFVDSFSTTNNQIAKIEKELNDFNSQDKTLQQERNDLEKTVIALSAKVESEAKQIESKKLTLEVRLADRLQNIENVKNVISKVGNSETTKSLIDEFEQNCFALKSKISDLENEMCGVKFDEQSFKQSKENLDSEIAKRDNIIKKYNYLLNTHQILSHNFENRCIIEKDLKILNDKNSLYLNLLKLVDHDALVGFVAEEYLKEIAGTAKLMLLDLTDGRFGLRYDREFYIEDNVLGGELRKINTISGGELFLVSLSLALSLSKSIYAKSRKPIEFFFLDEGFGSLDRELVDTVMDSLNKLRQSHLLIGIITHVEMLKERINAKICVTASTESTGSTLSVTF